MRMPTTRTRLADDPIHKLLLGRDPISGRRLASQPTLALRERRVAPRMLYRLGEALADTVIRAASPAAAARAPRHPRFLDLTEDATHGAQQLALFNGFYGGWCYLPLVALLTFDHEPRQYLVAAVLRPGTAPATVGVRGVLQRLLPKLWHAFPGATLRGAARRRVRPPGDLHAARGRGRRVRRRDGQESRAGGRRHAQPGRRPGGGRGSRQSARVFGETSYQARSWTREGGTDDAEMRRVVIKAEVVAHPGRALRDNPRFVVTNLRHRPERLYLQIDAARGDSENRIKELHHALALGRTSCTRFWANQLRVLLSAAAYVLMQTLQLAADHTTLRHAQATRVRQALLTIGVHVVRSVRRLVLHLPRSHPEQDAWRQVAYHLGAT